MTKSYHMENKKLYRFVTLFELYNLLVNKNLKFSKLSTFEDKNEGIFAQLSQQESIFTRKHSQTKDDVEKSYKQILDNNYASCWTTEKDSIALWSIYSKNNDCFRISTTADKLNEVTRKFFEENFVLKFIDEPGSRRFVTWCYSVNAVSYHNPFDVKKNIEEKFYKIKKIVSKHSDNINSKEYLDEYREAESARIIQDSGLFMKNSIYSYENEVRSILNCGVRSNLTRDEIEKSEPPYLIGIEAGSSLEMPDYIFAKTDEAFIDEICIDPRMQSYKRDIIKDIFKNLNISFETSEAFGCYIDSHDFSVPFFTNSTN